MPPLDTGSWLAPVEADAPTGPNLEFDAEFVALEQAAEAKAEQQFGDTVIPAEEPEWKEVAAKAESLLERTRDLRVLTHLAVARLRLGGLPEYQQILATVRQLLETRWAEVHPQLDPEDDNDPTLRSNALLGLADPGRVLKFLRDLPIARSPRLGRYSWRELSAAIAGEAQAGQATETTIAAAFQDSDPAWLEAQRTAAADAATEAKAIVAAFEAQAGPATGPDFEALEKLLREIAFAIQKYGAGAGDGATEPGAAEADAGSVPDGAAGTPAQPAAARAGVPVRINEVTTRGDALRLLDLVCQYYRKNEPSSPLPFLIERARRLADKDFIEILQDMAPDGLSQARLVAGVQES